MKFRIHATVLSLFFALGLVFSFVSSGCGSSDGDDATRITADEVDPTSEEDVKAFLEHTGDYYDQILAENADDMAAETRELVIFGRQLRVEGDYKHDDFYAMGINERGIVTNHPGHPELFGYLFVPGAPDSAVAGTIEALIRKSDIGTTVCETYGGQERVACARKVESPSGRVTTIAGLHHLKNDPAFVLPNCDAFSLGTNAEAVFESQSDKDLEAYVKGVIGVSQQLIADIAAGVFGEFIAGGGDLQGLGNNPAEVEKIIVGMAARLYDKAACFGTGHFRHKNIYAFIMDADLERSTVLFNGNNVDLNGTNLELDDDELPGDDKSIAGLFNRQLGDKTSAYANYRWDDPESEEDDVEGFFENRKVPGTSCKRSYIERADLNEQAAAAVAAAVAQATGFPVPASSFDPLFPPQIFIFGSGTYPGDEVCASDDGDDDDGNPSSS